jgi:hypothetical protein
MAAIGARVNHPGGRFHYRARIFDMHSIAGLNGGTVQPSLSNVPRRPFRDRGANARGRRPLRFAAIAAFAGVAVLLMGAAATATATNDLGGGFSLTAPSFSPTNAVRLDGTKDAGSSVAVDPLTAGGAPLCSVPASSATDWSCVTALPHGKAITLTAVETLDGTVTASAMATLDVLGAPSIDGSPGSLTSGIVSGYAFSGATVVVTVAGGTATYSSTATGAGY